MQTELSLLSKAQLDEYIGRLEETEKSLRAAEAKIAERDERIMEVERLLDCMEKVKKVHVRLGDACVRWKIKASTVLTSAVCFYQEKGQLQKKLREGEHHLRLLELTDTTDGTVAKR